MQYIILKKVSVDSEECIIFYDKTNSTMKALNEYVSKNGLRNGNMKKELCYTTIFNNLGIHYFIMSIRTKNLNISNKFVNTLLNLYNLNTNNNFFHIIVIAETEEDYIL